MHNLYENPHAAGCPWHNSAEVFGAPNIKWCEATICSWISEPANTWSNIAYLIFAIIIFLRTKNAPKELKWFAPAMFIMGLFSLIYHASNNYLTQVFDFFGMYLFVFWMIVINLRKINLLSKKYAVTFFVLLCLAATIILHFMYITGAKFQLIIAASVLTLLLTEFIYYRKNKLSFYHYKTYLLAIGFMAIAQTFSLLDVSRVFCDPENHFIQGHALWHFFGSIGLFIAYLHYEKLDYKKMG